MCAAPASGAPAPAGAHQPALLQGEHPIANHLDVSPRYLAGREFSTPVLESLVLAYHWSHQYHQELDQTFASSPDHRFRIGLNQLDPGAWWRIAAAREPLGPPQWQAGFSKETPAELIAAVTDQLRPRAGAVDWTGEEHPALQEGASDPQAIAEALRTADWREQPSGPHGVRTFESADGLARATIRPDADPFDLMGNCAFAIEIGPHDAGIPYWQALFTADVPAHITTGFIRAVTDPAPLRRDADWMDERLLAHLGYTLDEDGLRTIPPSETGGAVRQGAARARTSARAAALPGEDANPSAATGEPATRPRRRP